MSSSFRDSSSNTNSNDALPGTERKRPLLFESYRRQKRQKMSPDDEAKRAEREKIKRHLVAAAMQEIQPLALGSLAMVASTLANQAVPRLLGQLLDQKSSTVANGTCSAGGVSQSTMSSLALVMLGGGLASFMRTTMLNRAEDSISSRLRSSIFRSLLIQRDLEWFQMDTVGNIDQKDKKEEPTKDQEASLLPVTGMTPGAIGLVLNDDVTQVAHALTANLANLVRSTCSCVFGTIHMLRLNRRLFAMSFIVVPVIGGAAMVLRKVIKRIAAKQREIATLSACFAEERLLHISMVKMSNRELDEVEKYESLQNEYVTLGRRVSLANGTFMGFIFAASSGALFMVFNSGGKEVAAERMTAGQLTSFATYTFLLGLGTSGIFKALGEMMQSITCAERVYRLIDSPADHGNKVEEKSLTATSSSLDVSSVNSISFHHVHFAYRSSPETKVLRDISFDLQRGVVVALVGKNGSGKTTIASLLAALYKPQSGSIVLSKGLDYTSLERTVQKQLVQVVPQSPALFNASILENVKYSNPDATDNDAKKAMKMANCDSFLARLEGGMHYQVGQNGGKLSGGQRQRIGLARALLSDPAILVLDEPTSSLDAEGESAVSDAVNVCRGNGDSEGRALLLITHRAKTLELADIVMVLKNGEIVETGSFQQLIDNKESELCALMPDLG